MTFICVKQIVSFLSTKSFLMAAHTDLGIVRGKDRGAES